MTRLASTGETNPSPLVSRKSGAVGAKGFGTGMLPKFGAPVKKGTEVAISNFVLQRRPELYAEPLRFNPERFIGNEPSPHAWAPFGGGVRRCLGLHFALFEMKVLAATVLTQLDLRAVEPTLDDEVPRQRT